MEIGSPEYWSIFTVMHLVTLVTLLPLVAITKIAYSRTPREYVARPASYGGVALRQVVIYLALAWPIVQFGWGDAFRFWDALKEAPSFGWVTHIVLLVAALSPLDSAIACGRIRANRELMERRRRHLARITGGAEMGDESRLEAVMTEWDEEFDQPPSLAELLDESRRWSELGFQPDSTDVAARIRAQIVGWWLREWEAHERSQRQASGAERIADGRVAIVRGPLETHTPRLLARRGVRALVNVDDPFLKASRTIGETSAMDHPEIRAVIEGRGERITSGARDAWFVDGEGASVIWNPAPGGERSQVDENALAAAVARALRPRRVNRVARLARHMSRLTGGWRRR